METWIVFFRADILEGSPLAMDSSKYLEGEVFVLADNEQSAIEQTKTELESSKLSITKIFKCIRYSAGDWESSDNQQEFSELAEALIYTKEIQCSAFRSSEYLKEKKL